jgi:hypothetical protein
VAADADAPRQARAAYLAEANTWLDRCAKLVAQERALGFPEKDAATSCVRDAEQRVGSRYSEALALARMQRGTSMYLRRYHEQWTSLMNELPEAGAASSRPDLTRERQELHALHAKVIGPSWDSQ